MAKETVAYIFAVSTADGMFEQHDILMENEIVMMGMETKDGTKICEYVSDGTNSSFYYIDVTEVRSKSPITFTNKFTAT